MKIIIIATLLAVTCAAQAQTYVPGYTKKNGTYVEGHYRSAPDSSRMNNYNAENSVYGSNPYTGKKGSQRDEFSSEPAYNQPSRQQRCTQDFYGRTRCY